MSGYFPNSYFPKTYFTGSYFPPNGIIIVVDTVTGGGILMSQGLKRLHPDDRDLLDLIIIIDLSND